MKKIFNIFAAALMSAAVLTSCAEKEIVTYHPDEVVIPALQELSVEEGLQLSDGDGVIFATLQFSAADFGIATAARYTAYADIKEDFSSKQALANVTTDTAGIAISASTLNNALITLGCLDSVDVKVYFRIETQMMGESSPVGAVETLVSNTVSAVVKPYDAEKVYQMIYVAGTWNDWTQTSMLFCYNEDGNTFEGVLDFGADYANSGFKLCPNPNWDTEYADPNSDGNTTSTAADAPSMTLVETGGGNIINYRSHRYYNFCFTTSDLIFKMIKGFDLVTVAGAFNGWSTDATPMQWVSSNGKFYVDLVVDEAGAADGFKFVIDGSTWLGAGEIKGTEDVGGGNMALEPGQYRFYLDLNDWDNPTCSLSEDDYGTPVDGGGSDTPDEPEDPEDPENPEDPDQPEVKENLWGVIGSFAASAWGADIYMTEFPAGSGIWISTPIAFAAGDEFKLHFNNAYDQQVSPAAAGDTLRTGIPYEGQSNANNFKIAESQAGNRVIVYNSNDNTLFILGWGACGSIEGDSWSKDIPLVLNEATNEWTSIIAANYDGGFKLRWAGQFSNADVKIPERGLASGATASVGTPFAVTGEGGGDINVGTAGKYNLLYNANDETLTITAAE